MVIRSLEVIKWIKMIKIKKTLTGILLSGALFCGGCSSLQKSGYGIIKTIDGAARIVTGASVGEKMGIYSDNPNDSNYKAKEVYTGKGVGDRIKYIVTSPIGAIDQTLEGVGNIFGGIHGATIGQIPQFHQSPLEETSYGTKRITNPETKHGLITPTIKYGINEIREFGSVEKQSIENDQLKERFEGSTLGEKLLGTVPILNHFGDCSKSGKDRTYDAIGEALFLAPSVISGGSGSGSGGSGGGFGGGWGVGGPGGN